LAGRIDCRYLGGLHLLAIGCEPALSGHSGPKHGRAIERHGCSGARISLRVNRDPTSRTVELRPVHLSMVERGEFPIPCED
jgi:hypothetical protein